MSNMQGSSNPQTQVEQGTAEWHQIRLGKLTASRVADMMAKTRSGYGASRKNYAAQLVTERLTGQPTETFTSAAMQWGTDHEPEARMLYEMMYDVEVEEVAFVDHPSIAMSGASPDGLVGHEGLIEIKAPNSATHIETLLAEAVPSKYVLQMLWQMACTGRAWCDYVSYDPRMPGEMQLYIQRVERDDSMIFDIEAEAQVFLEEIDETVRQLRAKYAIDEAA